MAAEAAPHPVQCGPLSLQPGIHFLYFHISAGNLYSVTIFLFSNAILLMQWQGNGYKVIWLLGVTNLCNKES